MLHTLLLLLFLLVLVVLVVLVILVLVMEVARPLAILPSLNPSGRRFRRSQDVSPWREHKLTGYEAYSNKKA